MRQPLWRACTHRVLPFRRVRVIVDGAHRRSLLTESYARGPSAPPLLDQTVGQHFASVVSKFGDRTAVVSRHQQTRLTYEALDRKSNALARGLQDVGVKRGDRVAVSLGNNIEHAVV
ncbi:MAG: hypothetical protein L6R40_002133 [Gallowayella cf. fulva]|nr:MAG: hypothetical protein L6R40_002133 [Xanthomendoza cf. fulva]